MRPSVDTAAYWDEEAESYRVLRKPSAVDRRTLELLPPRGSVLELGAGPGVFTKQALAHPARQPDEAFVATDVSPAFCAMLASLPVQVVRADHGELVLPESSVDSAYAMATLHHLKSSDCTHLLSRLASWLRPGGSLVLVEDWAFTPTTEAQHHLVALRDALRAHEGAGESHPDEQRWRTRLLDAGLELLAIERVNRPESLTRYGILEDSACRAHLAWLRAHDEDAAIPMSLFLARRPAH